MQKSIFLITLTFPAHLRMLCCSSFHFLICIPSRRYFCSSVFIVSLFPLIQYILNQCENGPTMLSEITFFLPSLVSIIHIRILCQALISPIVNIANSLLSVSLPSRIYLNLKMYSLSHLKCHLHN